MSKLGLTIKLVIEVDEAMAQKFKQSPPGFLTLSGEPLGSEELTVAVINEEPVEPIGMRIKFEDLSPDETDAFLA